MVNFGCHLIRRRSGLPAPAYGKAFPQMLAEGVVKSPVITALSTAALRRGLLRSAAYATRRVVARGNGRDDRQAAPAALQPPVDRSVCPPYAAL